MRTAVNAAGIASLVNLGKVWLRNAWARKSSRSVAAPRRFAFSYLAGVAVGLALAMGAHGLPVAAQEAPRVVATSKPIHSMAAAVLGDAATPELLITGAASPHSYALKPSDASMLNSADVFIRVSAQVEPFTERIIRALPKTVDVVTLAETDGLRLLPVRYGGHFDEHAHDHGDHEDHGHELSTSTADGHVWLDPNNAKLMARRLAQIFAARWPQWAEDFTANAERFAGEVDAVSGEIENELEPVRDVPFVVFHDAYHYFEERFGLKTVGAITINPEVPPGARRLSALRQRIESLGGVCVFAEPQFNSRVLDAVVAGTGARSGVLDPIGADIEPGPGLYTAMLSKLADGFVSCLGHEPARAGR